MANPTFSFRLKPKEAIEYLKQKGLKQSFAYNEVMHEAHHKSFTVAKIMRNDLLLDIQNSLLQAQDDGVKFSEWEKRIKPTLIDYGWYGETSATDPKTGEIKEIFVGSRRLKNIFKTNMRVSYGVARYKKMKALPFSKYWMYVSMLLSTTRTAHSAKHGKVLERDDPWWSTNYPPNAWGCKCKVRAYSKAQLERKGITIEKSMGEGVASDDWAYDVGAGAKKIEKLRDDGIAKLPKALRVKAKEELKIDELYSKAIANAPLALQNYLFKNRPVIKKENITIPAQYNPNTKTIVYKEQPQIITLRHELGHHVDKINNYTSLKKLSTLKIDQLQLLKHQVEIEELLKKNKGVYLNDLFYLNSNRAIGGKTREDSKVIDFKLQAKETFANIFEIILSGDKQRLKIVEQYFPNAYRAIKKILERL